MPKNRRIIFRNSQRTTLVSGFYGMRGHQESGLRIMFVGAKQFEFILPGKLCQRMDIFDTKVILCNLTSGCKVWGIFGIAWSKIKYSVFLHRLRCLKALIFTIFSLIFESSRPFRQMRRVVNKNQS